MAFQQPQWMNPGGRYIAAQTHNIPGPARGSGGGGGLVSDIAGIAGLVSQGFDTFNDYKNSKSNRAVQKQQMAVSQSGLEDTFQTNVADYAKSYTPLKTQEGWESDLSSHTARGMAIFGDEAARHNMSADQLKALIESGYNRKDASQYKQWTIAGENQARDIQSEEMSRSYDQVSRGNDPRTLTTSTQEAASERSEIHGNPSAVDLRPEIMQQDQQRSMEQGQPPLAEPPPDASELSAQAGVPIDPELLRGTTIEQEQKYRNAQPVMRQQPHPVYSKRAAEASRKAMSWGAMVTRLEGKDPTLQYQAMLMSDKALGEAIENDLYNNFGAIPERLSHYGPKEIMDVSMGLYLQYRPQEIEDIHAQLVRNAELEGIAEPEKHASDVLAGYTKALDTSFKNGAYRMFQPVIGNHLAMVATSSESFYKRILERQKVETDRMGHKAKLAEVLEKRAGRIQDDRHHGDEYTYKYTELSSNVGAKNAENMLKAAELGIDREQMIHENGRTLYTRSMDMLLKKQEMQNMFAEKQMELLIKNNPGIDKQLEHLGAYLTVVDQLATINQKLRQDPVSGLTYTPEELGPDLYALYEAAGLDSTAPGDVKTGNAKERQ